MKRIKKIVSFILLFLGSSFVLPISLLAEDIITTISDAIIASETYANMTFQSFGLYKITGVFRTNTISEAAMLLT